MKINSKIEEGEVRIREFAQDLARRNKVPEAEKDAEVERLEGIIRERILKETLTALPDEDLGEIEETLKNDGEVSVEKWNSMMFMEKIRPESITAKVFRDMEEEYLGAENIKEEDNE